MLTESLQLTEQALGYSKQAYELALRTGRNDRDLTERANRLYVEINRLHQQGLFVNNDCK